MRVVTPGRRNRARPEAKKPRAAPPLTAPGRKSGKLHGVHVTELAELLKTIWLCSGCESKFNYRRYHYFREDWLKVQGNCDACKQFSPVNTLFVHESEVSRNGGQTGSWIPRKKQ